jgi:nitrogen regulatory protein P-II 1
MPEPQERELVTIVLNDPGHLNSVLSVLVEAGVTNATAIDTQGMGRLSQDVPIFASFRHLLSASKPNTCTVLAPVESREVTNEIIALLKDVLGDSAPEDGAYLFTSPIGIFADLTGTP